jgi:thiamine-monophosphate kinase
MDEIGRIAMLARILGSGTPLSAPSVEVGIGDDAAVLALEARDTGRGHLVWTIDEQVESVHFRRELLSWRDIGWRSFMAAASDVAAMGAVPWCALASLVIPDNVDDAALADIARGQRDAAEEIAAPVVGGNLSRGPALSIATTLLGKCERAVERCGARAGDGVWMAGRAGLAAAGLKALERSLTEDSWIDTAVEAWRRPRALVVEGRRMAAVAHAAIDVSDGLARDAGHVAEASGVSIVLDESALLADTELTQAARALDQSALDLALHGGEDYALVAASGISIPGFRRIGEVRKGSGLVLRGAEGETVIEARGFDHFSGKMRTPRSSALARPDPKQTS